MRITNSMMVQTMIRNLNRNMVRLNDKQIQFSTGKRINRPSDDPLGISKSLRLRTDIAVMDQYKRNVDDAYSFMDNTETALQNMLEGMQRIRELTVQGASATLTQEETSKMQAEIGEIRNQLTDLANYTYSGKNIFTGKKTGEALLDRDGNYLVNLAKATDPRMVDDKWSFEVSTRETIQVNTLGFEVFEAQMREVVYTELPAPPADWTLTLPLKEGAGSFELNMIEGSTDGPAKDPVTNQWNVGSGWEPDGAPLTSDELVTRALATIQETVGPQLGEYTFEVIQRNELDTSTDPPTVVNDVQYLKAVPKNATIADNYEASAVWNSGAIGPPDFNSESEQRITFNGTELIIRLGDPDAADGITMNLPPVDKNRMVLEVNGDPDNLTNEDYLQAYAAALNSLAEERGSEVAGFSFNAIGYVDGLGDPILDGDGNPTFGLQAIAPERSGSQHNKAYFGGTIGAAEPREDQLKVTGTSPIRYVEQGQKAGLFAMLDKLEANMLKGQQEDMSNLLGTIDAHINAMLTVRSEVGAKSNRMELIMNRIEDDTLNYRDLMSKIEDADMSKVIIELMNEENVYRSALGVGARIIQPTLLDFLR